MTKNKKVALCLASGGSRGMAHIGAIEELLSRGYEITSVSGCSIGSLIGGILAAGKLSEAHDWFCDLDKHQVFSLTDFSFGLNHMVKGNRVMEAIQEWMPDQTIETLPIPAAFVATDIINSREVVFTEGSLFHAIRASISIPMCFEPVPYNDTLLVDGGLTNPFPLNRVKRHEGDILVGINISARDTITATEPHLSPKLREAQQTATAFLERQIERSERLTLAWKKLTEDTEKSHPMPQLNYFDMVARTIDVQLQAACRLMTQMCRPDVLVEMPQNAYTTFDFDKAEEIIAKGRELMASALDQYEQSAC